LFTIRKHKIVSLSIRGDYGDVRLTCYYVYERLHYVNPDIGGCFISSTMMNSIIAPV